METTYTERVQLAAHRPRSHLLIGHDHLAIHQGNGSFDEWVSSDPFTLTLKETHIGCRWR
jgi:hypothetical protein